MKSSLILLFCRDGGGVSGVRGRDSWVGTPAGHPTIYTITEVAPEHAGGYSGYYTARVRWGRGTGGGGGPLAKSHL